MSNSQRNFKRKRLRRWLRQNTHWKNPSEFYIAVLFECGPPPITLTQEYLDFGWFPHRARPIGNEQMKKRTHDMQVWRNKVAVMMNEKLHHFIDPTHTMQEYLKWLLREQKRGRIRTSGL